MEGLVQVGKVSMVDIFCSLLRLICCFDFVQKHSSERWQRILEIWMQHTELCNDDHDREAVGERGSWGSWNLGYFSQDSSHSTGIICVLLCCSLTSGKCQPQWSTLVISINVDYHVEICSAITFTRMQISMSANTVDSMHFIEHNKVLMLKCDKFLECTL